MADLKQTKRKRARAHEDDEDSDESKRRGRPRVDKQDESAADRRRTQIRMAQRAYRQRKESTMDDLRKRATVMDGALEAMNKAFQDCRTRLSGSGLSELQLADLQETSQHFNQLMKSINADKDDTSSGPAVIPAPSERSESLDSARNVNLGATSVPTWIDHTARSYTGQAQDVNNIPSEYSSFFPDSSTVTANLDHFGYAQNPVQTPARGVEKSPDSVLPNMASGSDQVPLSLPPPSTYSFQETSFGRRLHRTGVEAGYHLLLNRAKRPQSYERAFRLSLMGRSESKLIASMRSILDRGPHESLDFWEAPLIHIGGAGRHYPRKDTFGNIQPKKASYNVGLIGPQTLALLEDAARNNQTTDMTVEIAGLEGDWYDPYDVEGYLQEKGIYIGPSSSFAEVEVTEWPVLPDSASSSSSGGSSPPKFSAHNKSSAFDSEQSQILHRVDADLGKWNDSTNLSFSGVGYSDAATGSWMDALDPNYSTANEYPMTSLPASHPQPPVSQWQDNETTPFVQSLGWNGAAVPNHEHPTSLASHPDGHYAFLRPRKKMVLIDVARLIQCLIVGSVCLGRTPGYRPRDVDRALAMASFDL